MCRFGRFSLCVTVRYGDANAPDYRNRFPISAQLWHEYGEWTRTSIPNGERRVLWARRNAVPTNARNANRPNLSTKRRLRDLALSYVAKFATSAGKLEDYLKRKLRERGYEGAEEGAMPDVSALVQRYVDLGYIDDAAWAKAKTGGLLRRGYGPRRVSQALHAAGIDERTRDEVKAGKGDAREALLVMARKKRFGPFATEPVDRAKREKQIAAMMRAGHGFDMIRAIMALPDEAAAEEWAADGGEWD